jgi:hypothetical protein
MARTARRRMPEGIKERLKPTCRIRTPTTDAGVAPLQPAATARRAAPDHHRVPVSAKER